MLYDRKIEFSELKEEEWNLIKSKIGDGIELPLPDSDRWFKASNDGDNIIIESAVLNVRPLKIHEPLTIGHDEFKLVAEQYNAFLGIDARTMSDTHTVKDSAPNLRFFFMLIYHLL